jgi:cell wall-associated NlpC family hydrolase
MEQRSSQSMRLTRLARLAAVAAVIASTPRVAAAQKLSQIEEIARDPRPFASLSNTAMSMRDSIVVVARSQIGTRYRFGGTNPKGGFDCSGLVRYVLAALKISLPRTAAQQASIGDNVPKDTTRLRPGDLLTFGRGNRVTHIGIYVGNGRYVHASPTAGRVIETSLGRTTSSLVKIWRGGRSVLADGSTATDSVIATLP